MSSAASIRARLMNISREESIPFQVLIFRFLHERLLYRMSRTKWADSFVLKGGNLMYAQQGILTRPTKDIDYLAVNLRNDISLMTMVFAEVCTESYSDDSVWFDEKSISAETISEQEKYEGVRIHIQAGFDTISQQIQIDIGFGDIMTPQPEKIVYPVLLKELESPFIKAYSNETVIAEKFQTMIELAEINSRMKDFYDVYFILQSGNYNIVILQEAIHSTFRNRETVFSGNHSFFSDSFVSSPDRNKMWEAFMKKINDSSSLSFSDVMGLLTRELQPIWMRMNENSNES